jgi:hypothetical protein
VGGGKTLVALRPNVGLVVASSVTISVALRAPGGVVFGANATRMVQLPPAANCTPVQKLALMVNSPGFAPPRATAPTSTGDVVLVFVRVKD